MQLPRTNEWTPTTYSAVAQHEDRAALSPLQMLRRRRTPPRSAPTGRVAPSRSRSGAPVLRRLDVPHRGRRRPYPTDVTLAPDWSPSGSAIGSTCVFSSTSRMRTMPTSNAEPAWPVYSGCAWKSTTRYAWTWLPFRSSPSKTATRTASSTQCAAVSTWPMRVPGSACTMVPEHWLRRPRARGSTGRRPRRGRCRWALDDGARRVRRLVARCEQAPSPTPGRAPRATRWGARRSLPGSRGGAHRSPSFGTGARRIPSSTTSETQK